MTLNGRLSAPFFRYLADTFEGDALVFNDALDVFVVHGMFDTITPYFASCYLLEQSVVGTEARARLSFGVYQGGHMFYLNDTSRAAFHADLAAFFGR